MRWLGKGRAPIAAPPSDDGPRTEPRPADEGRIVLAAAEKARRDVRERVDEVNRVTEREVLAAAQSVSSIIERATLTISRLKELASRFDGGDSVGQSIQQQTGTMRSFVSELVELARAQAQATLEAQRSMVELDRATRAIDNLASEA